MKKKYGISIETQVYERFNKICDSRRETVNIEIEKFMVKLSAEKEKEFQSLIDRVNSLTKTVNEFRLKAEFLSRYGITINELNKDGFEVSIKRKTL